MGNGPKARLPGRLCSFSDMGRMPHSSRASPSSGTAAPRILPHPPPGKTLRQAGKARGRRNREASLSPAQPPHTRMPTALERHGGPTHPPHPRQEKTCGKRAKPADAATGRPITHSATTHQKANRPQAAPRPTASSHIPRQEKPAASGQSPRTPQPGGQSHTQPPHTRRPTALKRHRGPPHLPTSPARKNLWQAGKARKAAAGRPALHPLSQTAPRHLRYASTTINSFVSSAVCTSSSIFSSRFFSCLRITFRFGLVTGCFATKMVQQSS